MEIAKHFGHNIVIARYGRIGEPIEFAIECETCFEVIVWEPVE